MTLLTLAQDAAPNDAYLIYAFVLVALALVLIFVELIVPSGGLIGVLAGIAAIGSVIAFFAYDTTWGLVSALAYLILGPIVGVFVFKLWLHSSLGQRMILGGQSGAPDGEVMEEDPALADQARRERLAQLQELIGAEGTTVTHLRPVGVVKIEGQRVDALAEDGVIDAGTDVVVTDVYDNQIKVRRKA